MDHRAIRIGEARRRRLIAGELLLRACDVAHGPYVTAAIEITRPGQAVALIFVRLACRVAARTAFCARRVSFALTQFTVAGVRRKYRPRHRRRRVELSERVRGGRRLEVEREGARNCVS